MIRVRSFNSPASRISTAEKATSIMVNWFRHLLLSNLIPLTWDLHTLIKPETSEAEQLDDGIGDTLVLAMQRLTQDSFPQHSGSL